MRKLLLLIVALLTGVSGAWADVTTVSTAGSYLTLDGLKALSGTGGHVAFANVGGNPWTNKWLTNPSANSNLTLSKEHLFTITNGSVSGKYYMQRVSDGQYRTGDGWGTSENAENIEFRVYSNGGVVGGCENPISIHNNSGTQWNINYGSFGGALNAWAAYAAYGPFYIVEVNYTKQDGTSVQPTDTHIVSDGTTVNTTAPEITNYRLVGASTPSVTVAGEDVTINYTYTKLPQTSTSESPIYYTIKNTKCGKYAKYAGDASEMVLTADRLESTANAFWFESVAEDNLPTGVVAVKIHNLAAGKCVAATNSFTDAGITWYLKEDVYTGTSSIAINSNSTTWDNNSYGWNDKNGYGTSIANYQSTDQGSAWLVDVLTSADITEMEAVYAHQIDVLKENAIAQVKASSILFGDYETDDTPANTAYTTISSVVRANTEEALTAATTTINSALKTMYATVVDKKIVFKNTNRSNKYMVVTDAVQLGGADAADGRSEFKINYVSDTDGHFTIQNTATGRYIANTPGRSERLQLATTAGEFTIKSYGTDNKFAFICTNPSNVTHNSIHLDGSSNVVAWQADGESSASVWVIEASTLTTEQITAGETAVRNQAFTKVQSYKSGIAGNVGTGLNTLCASDAYTTAVTAIDNATNAQEYETLLAMQGTLESAYNALSMNQPANGSFIRIRSVRTGMGYVNAEASDAHSGCLAVGSKGTSSIYYYKDSKLLAYNCGQYLIKNSDGSGFLGLGTTGALGASIVFGRGTKQVGTYYITFDGRYLYAGDSATNTDASGGEADTNYDFWLEDVDVLPVLFKGQFASFFSPVDLTLAAGVKAYTGTLNGDNTILTLTEVDYVPANTGVILEYESFSSETTVNFTIRNAVNPIEGTSLKGTTAAQNVAADSKLVLGKNDEDKWGIYKYGGTTLGGFKAYMDMPATPATPATPVKGFTFTFGDADAIANVLNGEENVNEVYDLSGRRVNSPARGLYIVNGKKVVIK